MLAYPSLVNPYRSKKAERARTAVSTMRGQVIFTFANTRARAGHRASTCAFSRWRAVSATAAASPREFFPIECVCRLKSIFLISSSRVGLYPLGTWTLLLSVFRVGIALVLHVGGAANPYSRNTPRKGLSSRALTHHQRRSRPTKRKALCHQPFASDHAKIALKESASRNSALKRSAFTGPSSTPSASSRGTVRQL